MTVEAALIVATALLILSFVGILVFAASRKQKAQDEELQRAASARGWKFEATTEKGYRVQRWTGVTDGVPWTAESLRHGAGGNTRQKRTHIGRWHAAYSPGIAHPMVAMGLPKGKEELGKSVADGDGFFARLVQRAAGFAFDKAIDVYFGHDPGKEVDATTMQRVDTKIPGFVVMANDKAEGARVMQQGLESALLTATNDTSSLLSDEDRPWILLRPNAVSLARMERIRDVNELEGFVRAGVALTRVFTFGRRV